MRIIFPHKKSPLLRISKLILRLHPNSKLSRNQTPEKNIGNQTKSSTIKDKINHISNKNHPIEAGENTPENHLPPPHTPKA